MDAKKRTIQVQHAQQHDRETSVGIADLSSGGYGKVTHHYSDGQG